MEVWRASQEDVAVVINLALFPGSGFDRWSGKLFSFTNKLNHRRNWLVL
jgi:hypothetical protein